MAQQPSRVNPPLDLTRDAFALNGGLDLTSPKINVQKGSLLDGYNREIIDRIGYKRIDGFEPFDGRLTPAQSEYYFIDSTTYTPSVSFTLDFPNRGMLVVDDAPTEVFGIIVGRATLANTPNPGDTTYRIFYARVNEDAEPLSTQVVNQYSTTSPDFTVTPAGVQVCSEDLGEDAREIVDRFNGYASVLRTGVLGLPDNPIGLHWFRDRLYSVVDDVWFYFDSGGTTEPLVNQFIGDGSNARGRILSVQLESGTWAGGNAKGIVQVENLGSGSFTDNTNLNIYPDNTFTTPSTSNILTVAASTDFTTPPQPLYASLWRTKSEQQAIDEGGNTGWTRIDLGYEIEYTNGLSDTGGFTVVNRGSENNFTFVDSSVLQFPTEILNGNNVSGTVFSTNSQVITLTAEQVSNGDPGWKTNVSATAFATSGELVTALEDADANFAYANLNFQALANNSPFAAGALVANDKDIWGPTAFWPIAGTAQPAAVGSETFDTDFLTTNARAPLLLKDFSAVASTIPEGSIVVGIEVTIPDYDVQSYIQGEFRADRNGINGADIVSNTIAWLQNAFSWNACVARSNTSTSSTIAGTVQTASLAFPTTSYQSSIVPGTETDSFRMAATLTAQSATIGGASNSFGNSTFTRTDLLDPALCIALFASISSNPLYPLSPPMESYPSGGSTTLYENAYGSIRIKLDQITVRFYYTTPSARYYVGDTTAAPADVCSIDVTYYVQEDGSFSAGTASGTLQFTNIQAVTGGKRTVESGDKIYLTKGDAEDNLNPVATISSNAEYNGLPARNLLVSSASRYDFITANFFGRDEWDGFYGVSGAGRAFSFATYDADGDGDNEDYLIQITTSTLDRAGDIPRHIAFHHYALALGFRSGIVRFSVPGEPENFDGVDGAAEVGVGDRVTGLLSMRGTVLGVFCENSIWGVAGTDADNYQTQVLAPYTGAIEYTVVDMGIPVYCDSRGISTLEQSEKYGNFLGQRLSAPVTPWILPRMIRNNAQFSGKGVVCAIPFRAKNQYVLFFKDGEVLCMTMNPDGPSFTYRNYYIGQSLLTDTTKFLVPFAWSSQVDEKGVDRVHVSHFSPLSAVTSANGKYVYEMDQGWGFGGNFIPAEYVINWFYQDPFTEVTLKKVRLDGLTQGVSSCSLFVGKDYDTTFSTNSSDISLPRNPLDSYSVEFVPATTMTNTNLRGRSMSLKVVDVIPSGDAITDPIPPDIHQAMMVQFDPGGKIDN
jgi:hypothetical protein